MQEQFKIGDLVKYVDRLTINNKVNPEFKNRGFGIVFDTREEVEYWEDGELAENAIVYRCTWSNGDIDSDYGEDLTLVSSI